ncbi:Cyclin_N domain-containing protein/Cyclin_C domain-containing protein, partial [Cephalotus follicularis]
GDIGNVITVRGIDGKPHQPNISRPITRSFCAQLLANAQAAAAAVNNKKRICANVDCKAPAVLLDGAAAAVGKRTGATKVEQKRVTVKPMPEVIEISLDTEQEANVKKPEEKVVAPVNNGKEAERSSKKKTLTSVVTARSKAAYGLADKSEKQILDIDAADANNDLAAVEYVDDIYKFYKLVENESQPRDYMSSQPDINEKMRSILLDWLIDVHNNFELSPETLYLTINIIDRFLSVKTVPRRELQLLGMGATLIASKYEEIWAPEVNDLVCIADRAYDHEQILIMEKTILGRLEWDLTVPTHYVFMVRFIKASMIGDEEMENMVYFLAELGVMNYETIMFCPSMVAASAVYAARCTLNKTPAWNDTLKLHTGFTESQLMDCAKLLVYFHSRVAESKLQVVYRKYSNSQRGSVALHSPAKSLLPSTSV